MNCWDGDLQVMLYMQGAKISDVMVEGSEVAVYTEGGPCGDTLSVFTVDDPELRERTVRALKVGDRVHDAVAATI